MTKGVGHGMTLALTWLETEGNLSKGGLARPRGWGTAQLKPDLPGNRRKFK
jgi:hypothetical protein